MCKECNEVKHICNGDKMFYESFDELTDDLKEKYCGLVSGRNYVRAKQGYVDFINELNKNGHILLSNYNHSKEKVLIDYNCGHEPSWITPNNYKKGARCQKCYDERRGLKGEKNPNYGKQRTEEQKRKQSKRMSGEKNPFYGCHHTEETKAKMRNNSLTDEDRADRRINQQYREWQQEVKRKANFTCDICGNNKSGNLESHHLDGHNWCKEKRYDINNGVCLCKQCHKEFHHIYGYGDNTKEQYLEFKESKQENLDSKTEDVA